MYSQELFDVNTMYKGAVAQVNVVIEVPAGARPGGRWLIVDNSDFQNQRQAFYNR